MHHQTARIDAIDRHNSSSSFIKLIRLSFHHTLCHSLSPSLSLSFPSILSLILLLALTYTFTRSFLLTLNSNSRNRVLTATRSQQYEHHGHRKYEPDNHDTRGICERSVIFLTDTEHNQPDNVDTYIHVHALCRVYVSFSSVIFVFIARSVCLFVSFFHTSVYCSLCLSLPFVCLSVCPCLTVCISPSSLLSNPFRARPLCETTPLGHTGVDE